MLTRAFYSFNQQFDVLRVSSLLRDNIIVVKSADHPATKGCRELSKWHYLQDVYVVLENYIPFDTERGDNS